MRITRRQLRQLIKEELSTLSEDRYDRRRDRKLVRHGGGSREDYRRTRAAQMRRAAMAAELGKRDALMGEPMKADQHGAYYSAYEAEIEDDVEVDYEMAPIL